MEMTNLYDARGLFVLVGSKNGVNLLTQSAEKWICMGKRAFEILADLFLNIEKASNDRTGPFLPRAYATTVLEQKGFIEKALRGAKKQFLYRSRIFQCSRK